MKISMDALNEHYTKKLECELSACRNELEEAKESFKRQYQATSQLIAENEKMEPELTQLRKELEEAKNDGWTCYHCGEKFITHTHAKLHFGIPHSGAQPACVIKAEQGLVKYIRELELRLGKAMEEDSDVLRDLALQRCEKANAVSDAEELGYSRGLKDYQNISDLLETHRQQYADRCLEFIALTVERDRLAKELEEVKKDAERYNFLRRGTIMDFLNEVNPEPETLKEFDDDIDKAMLSAVKKGT